MLEATRKFLGKTTKLISAPLLLNYTIVLRIFEVSSDKIKIFKLCNFIIICLNLPRNITTLTSLMFLNWVTKIPALSSDKRQISKQHGLFELYGFAFFNGLCFHLASRGQHRLSFPSQVPFADGFEWLLLGVYHPGSATLGGGKAQTGRRQPANVCEIFPSRRQLPGSLPPYSPQRSCTRESVLICTTQWGRLLGRWNKNEDLICFKKVAFVLQDWWLAHW